MNQITVIIPPHVYDRDKYIGIKQMCYLHEALHREGYAVTRVGGAGSTTIDGYEYEPIEPFNCETVQEAFINNESITVTLIKQDS